MAKLKTIAEEFDDYAGMIFAKLNPGPVQVEETRKAFFAGAWAMLCAMRNVGNPEFTEEQGIQFFEERHREGEEFYRELIRKYSERN
jgi:hypothetical protein